MSTHSRLACALVAAGLLLPAGAASADSSTGGATYRSKDAKTSSSHARGHARGHARPGRLGARMPLRAGMRGRDVRALQRLIRRVGIAIAADGQYGRRTRAALRRIERRAGRPVDGVLARRDLRLLRRIAREGGWPEPPAPQQPAPLPPGSQARVLKNGLAAAPADAPQAVKDIIAAGNEIAFKPYKWGGGHGRWKDSGYDCSGSVSYALHGAGLLDVARDSTGFESFGRKGRGRWVTLYANSGHVYMVVAGLRFDTSGLSADGSRWHADSRGAGGYVVRHVPIDGE